SVSSVPIVPTANPSNEDTAIFARRGFFMPFIVRPKCRFPVYCPVTYQTGLFEGQGTVWNVPLTGWRFSGDLPLRVGEVCSLTVNLSIEQTIYVAAGIVRWVRSMALKLLSLTTSHG